MYKPICVIFGRLQHYFVVNTSVNSILNKFITQLAPPTDKIKNSVFHSQSTPSFQHPGSATGSHECAILSVERDCASLYCSQHILSATDSLKNMWSKKNWFTLSNITCSERLNHDSFWCFVQIWLYNPACNTAISEEYRKCQWQQCNSSRLSLQCCLVANCLIKKKQTNWTPQFVTQVT